MLRTIRYPVSHPMLKTLIKYFWIIESESPFVVNHKLLPVSNIDFVLNFSAPIEYVTNGENKVTTKGFHFNGIRDKHYMINQTGVLRVFGISFFQTGLFSVLRMPLYEFTNKTIQIDEIIKGFTGDMAEKIAVTDSNDEVIKVIEVKLVKLVDVTLIPRKEIYDLINAFYTNIDNISINLLCEQYGINQRKLERIFNKYIGISPKLFQRINRFQGVINQLEKKGNDNFTLFAYDNNYYDQTHFIKDFKSFTGSTPTEFLNQNNSIKQITEYC